MSSNNDNVIIQLVTSGRDQNNNDRLKSRQKSDNLDRHTYIYVLIVLSSIYIYITYNG